MSSPLTLTPTLVRCLAVSKQRLAGPQATPDAEGILDVVRDLGCLQLDPISAVERTQLLVLWSRLGPYPLSELDKVLWEKRELFEYWAHAASLVLTEDYPLFHHSMQQYGLGDSEWSARTREWVETNAALHRHVVEAITDRGPLLSRQIEDLSERDWQTGGWNSGRNVSRMLDYLWTKGDIMVAGRQGGQKLWDLSERFFPDWTPRDQLTKREIVRRATQKAIRALGVATPAHIRYHFMRGTYSDLPDVLNELEAEGLIQQIRVVNEEGAELPGPWYLHAEDLPLLERLQAGEWEPRTTLLSPFDNLICDRARTELLWNFFFRLEIYVPQAKRQYGYYVLPILHGDRLIGRIDPKMDRKNKWLTVNAVFAEPEALRDEATTQAVADAIASLATFLKAKEVVFGERIAQGWETVTQRF